MDEYQLEIESLRRKLEGLRAAEADALVIEEYEIELRNLRALYAAAQETVSAGESDARMREALSLLGFGDWTLDNVYAFVYDAALDAASEGQEIASVVNGVDFGRSLLAVLEEDHSRN